MKGVGFMVGRLSGKGKLLTITVSDWKNWEVPALFASPYHNILIHAKMSEYKLKIIWMLLSLVTCHVRIHNYTRILSKKCRVPVAVHQIRPLQLVH